jgi:hypothetical protein
MAMLCALDWRHGLVVSACTPEPDGHCRVTLRHGLDEVVLHLTPASLDALTYAGLLCPRPKTGTAPWTLAELSCF